MGTTGGITAGTGESGETTGAAQSSVTPSVSSSAAPSYTTRRFFVPHAYPLCLPREGLLMGGPPCGGARSGITRYHTEHSGKLLLDLVEQAMRPQGGVRRSQTSCPSGSLTYWYSYFSNFLPVVSFLPSL